MRLFWFTVLLVLAQENTADDADILKDLEFFQNLEVAESHEMLLQEETESTDTKKEDEK